MVVNIDIRITAIFDKERWKVGTCVHYIGVTKEIRGNDYILMVSIIPDYSSF